MTPEDEEFNRIEREAKQRMEAVKSICRTTTPEHIKQIIKPWVGLTDEERDAMIGVTDLSGTYYYDDLYAVILLAEGKLREKNA